MTTTISTKTGFNAEQIEAMRDWVADCYDHDFFFDIDDLTDAEVVCVIKRDYEGGVSQFMEDNDFWEPNC